ncbi:uncharacterized protein LOC118801031 isoform X3 [Colossoma macropomum]|uniref:uncharacterized protein LOC118801031 isoform X3 n=1 Tax=Colossoma macropomum TaxID=42526 RepID=UPI001864CDA0|nr:uncharacterized protein LOC118801031 isoform X3 [Colossoma macropomum]
MLCLTAAIMALSSYLLLFLVAHSVSAVERHSLYHIYTVHYSSSQNTTNIPNLTAAVLLDGERILEYYSDKKISFLETNWIFHLRIYEEKQIYLHEFEEFIPFLEISPNGDHNFTKSYQCEVERSSSGDVTLQKSTAEYRLNGKIISFFNVNKDQWEAVDKRFLPVLIKQNHSPNFIQTTKDYLLRGCKDTVLFYLEKECKPCACCLCSGTGPYMGHYEFLVICVCTFACITVMAVACHMKMIKKGTDVKPPADNARREDLNEQQSQILPRTIPLVVLENEDQDGGDLIHTEMLESEDQDGGDAVQTLERLAQSMDFPPVMAEETHDRQDRQTAGLTTTGERFAHSMDIIRPTMAEDTDDGQDRWTQIAGGTTAGGRWNSKNISLPNLASEGNDHSDSQ